jgi:hypothetical protein
MPAGDGLGLHDDEDIGPLRLDAAQGRPEPPAERSQLWMRPPADELSNLLSQGEDLNCSVMPTAAEDSDSGQESEDEIKHEHTVVTRRNVDLAAEGGRGKLLFHWYLGVLATHGP